MRIDSDGECRRQFLILRPDGTNAGFLTIDGHLAGKSLKPTHLFAFSRVAEVKALLACMGHKTFV